ncbi:MAG: DNA N-6-adenine-methyltransferase [Plesiomonas sp.]
MKVVDLALKAFLPLIKHHHVLVRTDNMSVVAYINRQGGLRSRKLHLLAEDLLIWAQHNLSSLRAYHIPGVLNLGPDILSRDKVSSAEWSLHPLSIQTIWKVFGRAEVDLFASKDNAHCPTYFSEHRDALTQDWPNLPLYAFPPIPLIPLVLEEIRASKRAVLLIAPLWANQTWLSLLYQMSDIAPWPIPLRRDLLAQAERQIWHPRPNLLALHVWPINGYMKISLKV